MSQTPTDREKAPGGLSSHWKILNKIGQFVIIPVARVFEEQKALMFSIRIGDERVENGKQLRLTVPPDIAQELGAGWWMVSVRRGLVEDTREPLSFPALIRELRLTEGKQLRITVPPDLVTELGSGWWDVRTAKVSWKGTDQELKEAMEGAHIGVTE